MADQRTEQPTQRRLDRARKEGNFPASKEFLSAMQLLGFVALAAAFAGLWFEKILQSTRALLRQAFAGTLTPAGLMALARALILPEIVPLLVGGALLVALAALIQLSTTGFGLSGKKLQPSFERFNPLSRVKNLAGQNGPVFLQALVLLPVVAWVVYYEARENLDQYLALPWMSVTVGFLRVTTSLQTLLWRAAGLFLIVGVIDLLWQRRRYIRQLRMTKQEVRDEAKDLQGNPQIKMRIRRLQRDLLRRQMMQEVPKATAVIVNPTHYAVAIRYALETGGAPKVVAKGKNYLALRIRQKAIEHQVPIVENAPLAQALYRSAEVGHEIPANLYRAVAEILAYIYRLMNGRLPGG